MDNKFESAGKEVLVEIVKLAQKRGMKGSKGTWKEFLTIYDTKFDVSLSDPARRTVDVYCLILSIRLREQMIRSLKEIHTLTEMKERSEKYLRVVLVPCPFQGHLTPMLELATILYSNGFSITIAHTIFNSPNPANHPHFTFLPIPDNLKDPYALSWTTIPLANEINAKCQVPFMKSMTQIMEQKTNVPVACIIYDRLMIFAEAVAAQLMLPSIILRTSSAASSVTFNTIPKLLDQGYLPVQDSKLQDLVPGLYPLRFKDITLEKLGNFDGIIEMIMDGRNTRTSSAIIWNTMDHLEHSSLSHLNEQYYKLPFFSIGPLHKMASAPSTSLLEEDKNCITWLTKQDPRSVIYVSLGSLATIDKKEVIEMAWGLVNSAQPFLWVVRPGSVCGSKWIEFLPDDFIKETKERGLIVKWAPQKEVLAHVAIGVFWSHCGWNSTLESISEGVPMICMPNFSDQKVNARYISHVWKVGIQLDCVLERGEFESAIKRLVLDEEKEEIRHRAIQLKEEIALSMRKGGSSFKSLNNLVEFIVSFRSPK